MELAHFCKTRKNFQKSFLILVISTVSFLYVAQILSGKLPKSNRLTGFDDNADFNRNLKCDKSILRYADEAARSYLKSAGAYKECDVLNSTELVTVNGYSASLNIDMLATMMKVDRRNITCKMNLIDKVLNVSESSSVKILKAHEFCKKANYTVQVDTHGFYLVSCFLRVNENSTKDLYEDTVSILPLNMSVFIDEHRSLMSGMKVPFETEQDVRFLDTDNFLLKEKKLNVLMIGIDSISYYQMKRTMPITFNYLSNVLENNVMFTSVNVVAENTFPNLMAQLTGILTESVPALKVFSEIETYKKTDSAFYDNYPFIWNQYEKNGYLTAYQEDAPSIGTFNYNRKGFRFKPTCFYGRAFWVQKYNSMKNKKNTNQCARGQPVYKLFFKIIEDFLKQMHENEINAQIPYFFYNFLTQYTHDNFVVPVIVDQQFAEMLINFENKGYFNDTLLIIFSDHGHRLVSYSYKAETGKVEKLLPFLSVRLPRRLWNTSYETNLKSNKHRLVGAYDIYQTLRHFSHLNAGYTRQLDASQFSVNNEKVRNQRGISLLEHIPEDRSCTNALISENFCGCLKRTPVNETNFKNETNQTFNTVAEFIVNHVNNITKDLRTKCVAFTLKKVDLVTSFGKKNKASMFQFVVVVKPGDAYFEATIKISPLTILGKVIRLSLYGDQSHCVYEPALKNYCFCKDKLAG